uniref:FATC domain-containing protein n=1 Tax=Oreochromis aureus TaxID=47969 RepID=A0AAZ1XFC8_OREAU
KLDVCSYKMTKINIQKISDVVRSVNNQVEEALLWMFKTEMSNGSNAATLLLVCDDLFPGSGDHHGENILFDSFTGEYLHVDFNCLFSKVHSHKSDYCQIQPFINIKNESLFLIFLASVLKTFLHDPLVEWSKQGKGLSKAQANETGEIVNEKRKTELTTAHSGPIKPNVCFLRFSVRLKPMCLTSSSTCRNKVLGFPLSIEGHVHYLIQEATDDKLLCQMYLGWGPYL